jgi:uncharacterized protein (TIGR02145 family)
LIDNNLNLYKMNRYILKFIFIFSLITFSIVLTTCKELEKEMLVSTGEVDIPTITTNSANVDGIVIDLGGGATEYGHCYGTTTNLTISGTKTTLDTPESGSFTSTITNLDAGTKYYVKAYITNGSQTVYGKERYFSTLAASLPEITTTAISSITRTDAGSGGNITSDGGAPVTARGVCWNTSAAPTTDNFLTSDETGTGTFSSNLANLTPGTVYYVRAYATNSAGTSYGEQVQFSTESVALPTLTTAAVTYITETSATGEGNINDNGGSAISASGVCWSTTNNPDITGSHSTDGNPLGTFTSSITGLTSNTTYYVRAYATNSAGTAYGNEVSFTTSATAETLPALSTTAVTEINSISATGGGNITSNGGTAITASGVCWSTTKDPVVSGSHSTDGSTTGAYTSSITGLSASTTYFVRAYATNSAGTGYGNEVSFTTSATAEVLPALSTTAVTEITSITATSGGNISSNGGAAITTSGVCWSTAKDPVVSGSHSTDGSTTGAYASFITGLSASTTYYVRAYATNSAGTGYGNEVSFTTSATAAVLPTLSTTDITAITTTAATSGGNITSDGGSPVTVRGVCWSINTSPTIGNGQETSNGSGSGTFVSNITGLSPGTVYYVRAYATNTAGTAYGVEIGFTTNTVVIVPELTTTAITLIKQTTASSGGNITSDGGAVITERGVCWSTSPTPIVSGSHTSDGTTSGIYTSSITGLSESTTYYVRAFATNSAGTAYGQEESFATFATPVTGTFTDTRDGNSYNWVQIGTKKWMSENLAYLPSVSPSDQSSYYEPYYYVYGYQSSDVGSAKATSNYSTYGVLYNWNAAMAGSNSNDANPGALQGVCPDGWHLPSDSEWKDLEMFYGMTSTEADQTGPRSDIGGVLKEEGTAHWSSPNTGATNASGFTALPGGKRNYDNSFFAEIYDAYWWTSTENNSTYAYNRIVDYAFQSVNRNYPNKDQGLSVRCVEGQGILVPAVETSTTVSSITSSGSVTGGTVTDNGGSPVTVRGVCWNTDHNIFLGNGRETVDGTGIGTFSSTITGLTASTLYYFRAYATNSAGTEYGNEQSFTTSVFTVPDAPTAVSAVAGNTQATVTFTAPISDGGQTITLYTVTSSPGSFIGTGSASPVTVGGLANGTAYTFTVTATSSIGTSGASTASNSVTPSTIPDAPTIGTATAGDSQATITFTAPTNDGGSPITLYTATSSPGGLTGTASSSPITVTGLTNGIAHTFTVTATSVSGTSNASLASNSITPSTVPTLSTTAISSITSTTAISGGIITSDGGSSVTERGVCWSTISNPTTTDSKTTDGTGTGSFTSSLTVLTPNTSYYARAYATNSAGTAYGSEESFTADPVIISDFDGNTYNVIRIGTQLWTMENLKTTKLNDGTSISYITDNSTWNMYVSPAYCWYSNDEVTYKDLYGALYNWHTVNTGKLCPTGWHVPSDVEWSTLTTYLGGESVAGGKLKETGIIHWTSPNTGATNETGFSALPGGYRGLSGTFVNKSNGGYWWSSIEYLTTSAWSTNMRYNYKDVVFGDVNKQDGFSIRCIKD